jgi:KDO2-lipid IV(A) lauroyltransferase
MVMERERDERARELQDRARAAQGVGIAHIGVDDPLASLPILHHVRAGGVAALQVDRVPRGMKARAVRIFGLSSRIPEGPLRLAQLSGAPIVPIFAVRTHYRRYLVHTFAPVTLPRRASDAEIDRAAQSVADAMTSFLRAHETQWFHFNSI